MVERVVDFFKTQLQGTKGGGTLHALNEGVFSVEPVSNPILFVGRLKQISELAYDLKACFKKLYKKIIIYGESGIGKSSLISLLEEAEEEGILNPTYKIIQLSNVQYVDGIVGCYKDIVFALLGYLFHHLSAQRDTEPQKKACNEVVKNLVLSNNDISIKSINELLRKHGVITDTEFQEVTTPKLEENGEAKPLTEIDEANKMLFFLYQKIGVDVPLIITLDNIDQLLKFGRQTLQQLMSMINLGNWYPILVLQTKNFEELKSNNDEILKDAVYLEMPPLTIEECKEILRKRILFYNKNTKKPEEKSINYTEDLMPFAERAVEILAKFSNGNPLKFIGYLKQSYLKASDKNSMLITEGLAKETINEAVPLVLNYHLTPKQQRILDYIKDHKEVTIDDIKNLETTSNISAFFVLRDLYDKGFLEKRRRGRNMIYSFRKSNNELAKNGGEQK
jgi:hypothetical protein